MSMNDDNAPGMRATRLAAQSGYTLVELAIVLLIAGFVIVPAAMMYSLYIENQKISQTQMAVSQAKVSIGDFKAIYGRYPCPARKNAVQGDVDYGYESRDPGTGACLAAAGAVERYDSANMALPDRDVFVGVLPFRQMNLPDTLIRDGYGNRLTYAVTGMLTNDATYANDRGGIGIVDAAGGHLTALPDTAHFVLVSHGRSDNGAVSNAGVPVGTCPSTPEGENCDADSVFRAMQQQVGFDDVVLYNTADSVEQWQISNLDEQNIHLRRADRIVTGVSESAPTAGFADVEIKETLPGAEDAVLLVSSGGDPGRLEVSRLCKEDGTGCFDPALIGGLDATGGGMKCGPGAGGKFLVGIANGTPICSDEIFFSCPAGSFLSGIDASGRMVCDAPPPPMCPDQALTTRCGDVRTVSSNIFSSGVRYGYAYAGECYKIAPLTSADRAALDSMTSLLDIKNYIGDYTGTLTTGLNYQQRTAQDCGPDHTTAMTRDTFRCESSGSWNATPVYTVEREYTTTNLSLIPPISGGNWSTVPTEIPGPAYNPAAPMAVDPANSSFYRDCWCREDYRVVSNLSCYGVSGAATNAFRIDRHPCPQTMHQNWQQVYPVSGDRDNRFCACAPGTTHEYWSSCSAWFGVPGDPGITGSVYKDYKITCPSGPTGAPSKTWEKDDTSGCTCPAMTPNKKYTTDACPTGTANSFTYDGVTYTNVAKLYRSDWVCPGGTPPQPVSSAADKGRYTTPTVVHTEACVCDTSLTKNHTESCPAGSDGTGKHYVLPWNCTTGAYDPPSPSNMVLNDCHGCKWQKGTAETGLSEFAAEVELGADCANCSETKACYEVVGGWPKPYQRYTGCVCAPQAGP